MYISELVPTPAESDIGVVGCSSALDSVKDSFILLFSLYGPLTCLLSTGPSGSLSSCFSRRSAWWIRIRPSGHI